MVPKSNNSEKVKTLLLVYTTSTSHLSTWMLTGTGWYHHVTLQTNKRMTEFISAIQQELYRSDFYGGWVKVNSCIAFRRRFITNLSLVYSKSEILHQMVFVSAFII